VHYNVAEATTLADTMYPSSPKCFSSKFEYRAAEMQAIDRTHRLGQHRPIRAVRFIAEGTVEEGILQLQEKKRLVFDGTVGKSNSFVCWHFRSIVEKVISIIVFYIQQGGMRPL
jgi:hypothetical protein